MQAMETGKGLGGNYLGRTGLMPFGHNGMLLGGDQAQGKVCESKYHARLLATRRALLTPIVP